MVRRLALVLGIVLVVVGIPASTLAAPGNITLVSATSLGVKGNGESTPGTHTVSADGTKVIFTTYSTNLLASDTDTLRDVYVKDVTTGALTLASVSESGAKGNDESFAASISDDGTLVAFDSNATNLDPADTEYLTDVYVKNLDSGDLSVVSTSDDGVKGNGTSGNGILSGNGKTIVFNSAATNLDPADTTSLFDVYLKNLTTGDVVLVSTNDSGVKGNGESFSAIPSADGSKVAFISTATNLDPADTDSLMDVYVKDLATGNITLATTNDSGVKGNAEVRFTWAALSADGTAVAFETTSTNLDPNDRDSISDVYVKNLATGDLQLASVNANGVKGNLISEYPSLSADGTMVAFQSLASNLDPIDRNNPDIYVKNLTTGDLVLASTNDAGTRSGNETSFFPSLTPDGNRVVFGSRAGNFDPADPLRDSIDVYLKDLSAGQGVDLSLTKTDRRDPVRQGRTISYTLSIQNLGPTPATNVTVTDNLPPGVSFVSATSTIATCSQSAGTVTCVIASLAPSNRPSTVSVAVSTSTAGVIVNTASVVANEQDPNSSNNQDSESTTVT
jgi:uncharacterized repeat protein (TIGR01451 family)